MTINISVGIIVHNEAENISKIVKSFLTQKLTLVNITEIIVVSSGSTDGTNDIVEEISRGEKKVKLLTEDKRYGKASGVNIFLHAAQENVVILSSGDLLPENTCVENLCVPFTEPTVGMTGVHSIPVNDHNTFWGYTAHILWELHHQVSLINPKMGEMIAFRKCFDYLDKTTSMDEASIERLIKQKGFKVVYVPSAVIYNKSPTNFREFVSVRRRNYSGHLSIKKEMHYEVATLNLINLIKFLPNVIDYTPKHILYTILTAVAELYGRALGYIDYTFGHKQYVVWDIAQSARNPIKNSLYDSIHNTSIEKKVGIVVLTYNSEKVVEDCLTSVNKIQYNNKVVVLVDNNSTDNTIAIVKSKFPGTHIIQNSTNTGFASGNNTGIEYLMTHEHVDSVILLNDDTTVKNDLISKLIQPYNADPTTGITGPVITYENNKNIVWFGGGYLNKWFFYTRHLEKGKLLSAAQFKHTCDYITGCCMCISKEVINKVGMFSNEFFMYFEDVEYCLRCTTKGFSVKLVPDNLVYHKVSTSAGVQGTNKLTILKAFYIARNPFICIKKHMYGFRLILNIAGQLIIRLPFYMAKCLGEGNFTSLVSYFKGLIAGFTYPQDTLPKKALVPEGAK